MKRREKPRFGATIDGNDAILIDRVVPLVDIVEFTPDRWATMPANDCAGYRSSGRNSAGFDDEALAALAGIAAAVPVIAHGVGLSLASHDGWNETYIDLVDQLAASRIGLRWHSEHLAFSRVDGESLGTMVEPPWSQEALELVAGRIGRLQDRFGMPFLIEHVARAFADAPDDEFAAADFLNALVRRTGCGLLLDVYNLECDEHNFGIDPMRFVGRLDLGAVREIHIAGGTIHHGFKLDIHSRLVDSSTIALTRRILARAWRVEAVIFEFLQEAIPTLGYEAVVGELFHLRAELDLV